jgi:glutathionyl-hydroquinone reductase
MQQFYAAAASQQHVRLCSAACRYWLYQNLLCACCTNVILFRRHLPDTIELDLHTWLLHSVITSAAASAAADAAAAAAAAAAAGA